MDSLDRLGILYLTTSVGLGTGGNAPSRRGFSRWPDHRISRHKKAPIITPHPTCPTDLPMRLAACLTTENHLRGRLPFRVTLCASLPGLRSQRPRTLNPEGNDATRPEVSTHPFGSYGTPPVREYPLVHPFDYACRPRLRTRLTRDDERGPGTLGHPADGILTRLSLLMSAFSLPRGPRHASTAASPHWDALLPSSQKDCCRVSVVC